MNSIFSLQNNLITSKYKTVNFTNTTSTICGNGTGTFSGDGSAATSAQVYNPNGVCCAPNGNIYIADTSNNRIRKINIITGNISTIAGSASSTTSGDGGASTSANLNNPFNIVCDPFENLFISQGDGKIRLITFSTGIISTIITGLSQSYSVTYYKGKLYVGTSNTTVTCYTNTGTLFSTYSTTTQTGYNTPIGIAFDSAGSMFVANYSGNNIIKSANGIGGTQTTPISTGGSTLPLGLAIDAFDNIFVSLQSGNLISKYTKSSSYGSNTTVVGSLNGPWNIAFGNDYTLYFTDSSNNRVKKVTNV